MIRVTVVVRELNRKKPDFSLDFDLPAIPNVGDYISIYRSDSTTHTEDVVVRKIWWQLYSPENRTVAPATDPRPGRVQDIMVECDVALGPSARDDWREWAAAAEIRGAEVEHFEVERFSVRESELKALREDPA